jgi:hypothetical protein
MFATHEKPATKEEIEAAVEKALAELQQRWKRDQVLRDQYGDDEERFLANQRALLRIEMLKRGAHTRQEA